MSTQALETRMARLEGADEQINQRLGSLEQKLNRYFLWMLGLLIVAIFLPMASRFTH